MLTLGKRKKSDDSKDSELDMQTLLAKIHVYMSDPDNGFEDSEPLQNLLQSLKFDSSDWQKHFFFSDEHYTRNLVATKDFTFDLLILCWQPGQKSAIHDHRESGCWMRMLQGELTETRYKVLKTPKKFGSCDSGEELSLPEEHLVISSEESYRSPSVFYINNDLGLHRVENSGKEPAISLHLYSPPITDCEVWLESGPSIFKTSLHSIFGMKLPQHMFKPKATKPIGGKYWPLAIGRGERITQSSDSDLRRKKQKTELTNNSGISSGTPPS